MVVEVPPRAADQHECHAVLDQAPGQQRLFPHATTPIRVTGCRGLLRHVESLLDLARDDHLVGPPLVLVETIQGIALIKVSTKTIELLTQTSPIGQSGCRDALGQRELSGQLKPLDRFVRGPHFTGTVDIAGPTLGQSHEPGHVDVVAATELRDHRSHRGVTTTVLAIVGSTRQRVARLHRDRCVVAGTAVDRPQDRQLVSHRRLHRQVFTKTDAGNRRRNRPVGTPNLTRRIGLGIPQVQLAGTPGEPEQDHSLAFV